jgi:hypothetical protein
MNIQRTSQHNTNTHMLIYACTWAMDMGRWHGAGVMRQWWHEAVGMGQWVWGSGLSSVGIGKWAWIICIGYLCFYAYMYMYKHIQAISGWGCLCILTMWAYEDMRLYIECMYMWTCFHMVLVCGHMTITDHPCIYGCILRHLWMQWCVEHISGFIDICFWLRALRWGAWQVKGLRAGLKGLRAWRVKGSIT